MQTRLNLQACSFQSTPAITGERAGRVCAHARRQAQVSIHARHYWRASPCGLQPQGRHGQVSIHARHYWRASLLSDLSTRPRSVFQSTPAITGERAPTFSAPFSLPASFNPRPPLLASEPPPQREAPERRQVSIHARHYWRASRGPALTPGDSKWFQSTPAITGERASGRSRHARCAGSFNPRPPLLASEPHVHGLIGVVGHVSIHARHYWRASPGACRSK